jgi:selenocysteine-specific elongation factor
VVDDGTLEREGARLRPPGAPARGPRREDVRAALEEAGLLPATPAELAARVGEPEAAVRAALAALAEEGAAARAGAGWLGAAAAREACARVLPALRERPRGIGELRDLWGVSRRHALMLAAHLDATGLTRRVGEVRTLRAGAAGRAPAGRR